jgi:hypothetical protein
MALHLQTTAPLLVDVHTPEICPSAVATNHAFLGHVVYIYTTTLATQAAQQSVRLKPTADALL